MTISKNLTVLFPGTGYTCDKPLLRVCAEAYAAKGYGIVRLSYGGLDFGAMETIAEAVEAAAKAVRGRVAAFDGSGYADVVFVGKSLGTLVAPRLDAELGVGARHLWLTPTAGALPYLEKGTVRVFAAAVGALDSHVDVPALTALCADRGVRCAVFAGVGHSLERDGDASGNAEILDAVAGLCG